MNNDLDMRDIGRRTLVALLSASFAFGPLSLPAYATTTPLADVPIAAKVAAKPNIVYTVDDSGSMASNFIPDFVTSGTYPAFCRGGIQVNAANGKPNYLTSGGFNITQQACGAGSVAAFNWPAFYVADFNHLAYDPNVTYQPPLKADGTPLTNAVITDAAGNQIDLKKVQTDPYLSPATTVDLSLTVTVPLYCNTDWPIITNPVAIGEVGTPPANMRPAPAPIAGSTAPNTPRTPTAQRRPGRLQLPVAESRPRGRRRRGGQRGCLLLAPELDAADLVRQDERELAADLQGRLECTRAAPSSTRRLAAADLLLQQRHHGCVGATVFSPAGCNTNPAYDLGGCVGPECLKCTNLGCPIGVTGEQGFCHVTANGGPPGSAAPARAAPVPARVAPSPRAPTTSQAPRAAPRACYRNRAA